MSNIDNLRQVIKQKWYPNPNERGVRSPNANEVLAAAFDFESSSINVSGGQSSPSLYTLPYDAIAAYKKAEKEYYGEYIREEA